jgi:hypothetical protein
MRVASEHSRTELIIENDARLLRAVGGVVQHASDHVGFSEETKQELADAVEEACRETFPLGSKNGTELKVTIEDFDDRVEVILDSTGEPLPKNAIANLTPQSGGSSKEGGAARAALLARIDRVLYEAKNGRPRIRLVKYLPGRAPKV